MESNIDQLKQVVIQLHDAARSVSEEMELNTLTLDIRECADRLNELIKLRSNNG
jgi:hypothetical protein